MKNPKDVPLDWSESRLQSTIYLEHSDTYKDKRGLLFMVDNNETNGIKGAIAVSMGRVPGVSDLIYLHKGKCFLIEIKLPWKHQQPVQVKWEELVTAEGFEYVVVDCLIDAREAFRVIHQYNSLSQFKPFKWS